MSKKAKITARGDKDSSDLTNCYFLSTNTRDQYILCDENDVPIVTTPMPVYSGRRFTFVMDMFTWTIPMPDDPPSNFVISGSGSTTTASGSWHNTDHSRSIDNDPTGESGTFTAQAGADPEEEAASAAKA